MRKALAVSLSALVGLLGYLPWSRAQSYCWGNCALVSPDFIDIASWKAAPKLDLNTKTLTIRRIFQPSIRKDLQNQYLLAQKVGSTLRYSQLFFACPLFSGEAYLIMGQLGILDPSKKPIKFEFVWGTNAAITAEVAPKIFQHVGYGTPQTLCGEPFKKQFAAMSYQNLLNAPFTLDEATISAASDSFLLRFDPTP